VLRTHRIGLDLGIGRQPRPDGVPRVRRAIVLPVHVSRRACFVQLRTPADGTTFPKYLSSAATVGPNPRVGLYRPAAVAHPEWIVTEGIFDALAATTAGYRAAAVLGTGCANRSVATHLARLPGPLVVAFDGDAAGRSGARRLVALLAAQRREAAVLSLPDGDLNDRAAVSGDWPVELEARVDHAVHRLRHLPPVLVRGAA
jgi:hypothetical protein